MIDAWLDLPTPALFAVLILFYGITTAIIVWFCAWSPLKARILTLNGLVAPFFTAISVMFALLTGFLGSDVGDRNKRAWQAVNAESTAAHAVYTLSVASASAALSGPPLRFNARSCAISDASFTAVWLNTGMEG